MKTTWVLPMALAISLIAPPAGAQNTVPGMQECNLQQALPPASSQEPSLPPAQSSATSTPQRVAEDKVLLTSGTKVNLRFDQKLSSATANKGDSVSLVLTEDLKVRDIVVAKAGATAVGIVYYAKKAVVDLYYGPPGEVGELKVRIRSLESGNLHIALAGEFTARGRTIPFWVTNAVIKKGQPVTVLDAKVIAPWSR